MICSGLCVCVCWEYVNFLECLGTCVAPRDVRTNMFCVGSPLVYSRTTYTHIRRGLCALSHQGFRF